MNHFDLPGSFYQTAASGFLMQNKYLQQSLTVFLPLHQSSCAIPLLHLVNWQACKNSTQGLERLIDPHKLQQPPAQPFHSM